MHLVHHKSALKNRIHSTLINFGRPCPVTDLFGAEAAGCSCGSTCPSPGARTSLRSIELIDQLEGQIDQINRRLRAGHADHPYIPLLMTVPGIRWVFAFTIAAEIGEIARFFIARRSSPVIPAFARASFSPARPIAAARLLKARSHLSSLGLVRGDDARPSPSRLLGALPAHQEALGKQRGAKVAQVDIARRLSHAIWHMLTRNEEFAPRGAAFRLAA